MTDCDVLIVGGGPAGSSCARHLVKAGLRVIVMDKKTFPRDKVCAGWVTPQVMRTLDMDLADYTSGGARVLEPITAFRTGLIGGKLVHTTYDEPVSYGIRRCEFDTYLLTRCGANLHLGESVTSIERDGDTWAVNGEVRAKLLIGAGGHGCPVARRLGARSNPASTVIAAQEIEFPMTAEHHAACEIEASTPELYFCEDLAGYGWCFRKGDYLNIGLGRADAKSMPTHMEAFVRFLRDTGRIGFDMPGRFHGHAYQLYERHVPKLVDTGVMLIGDAVGLAYPQSGEGIRPAVESGIIAAQCVAQFGVDAPEALDQYSNRMLARFGKPRRGDASAWLPASTLRSLAQTLMGTRWFNKRIVIERWFLHQQQPALVASA